jgi:hypothetical protein
LKIPSVKITAALEPEVAVGIDKSFVDVKDHGQENITLGKDFVIS